MNEIAGQAFAFKRHLDDVDLDVRERREAVEAIDRGAVGIERRFVLRGAKAFAHLIIVTSAQIEGRGRDRMAGCGEALGVAAHFVADLDAGVEPGCVVLGVFARERPSDFVQLVEVGAAVGCAAEHVDEGRRPSVVAGKVHEIFRRLGHRSFPPSQSHAGARPVGLAILHFNLKALAFFARCHAFVTRLYSQIFELLGSDQRTSYPAGKKGNRCQSASARGTIATAPRAKPGSSTTPTKAAPAASRASTARRTPTRSQAPSASISAPASISPTATASPSPRPPSCGLPAPTPPGSNVRLGSSIGD